MTSILDEPREDPDGIRVSTVHAAKGLEFRVVAVVGLNEGSFPDFRNTSSQEDLASERRLAYVAATRASRALLLTLSTCPLDTLWATGPTAVALFSGSSALKPTVSERQLLLPPRATQATNRVGDAPDVRWRSGAGARMGRDARSQLAAHLLVIEA